MEVMPVRVDVLGPLRLTVDGHEVAVPGPKRRALLALLATADDRAVPAEDLIDALWPDDPPETARASLQSHVSRLRRHLGDPSRPEGISGAYRLPLGPAGSDLAAARAMLAAARDAAPSDRLALLGDARALWRGDALAEFTDVARLAAVAVSIAELRRMIDHGFIDALLDAGDVDGAVAAATDLVAADAVSEPAVLLLMRALASANRPADGLRAAYEFRGRLVSETGLDPTPALAAAESGLASVAAPPTGLIPRFSQPLRGRDSELAALLRLLSSERLVTVVGPGGVGKTRLAMEIARGFEPTTAVLLAAVNDDRAVPQTLADALGLRVVHGEVLDACAMLLAAGPRLLVLDNCEHLLGAVSAATQRLLDACPDLTILATSREPLGLPAEQRLRIAPLPLPPRDTSDRAAPAVALFVDRATRVDSGVTFGPDALVTVGRIVRRLDGLPLAIELAAARLASLGLDDLLDRLDTTLDVLGGNPDRALRDTIGWSYDLLPPHEQRLFRHLSAFADGIALAPAEALAADVAPEHPPIRSLAHIVDASMVQVSIQPATRYRMLETVRAYAHEQLTLHDEADHATERFLQWALDFAVWVDTTTHTGDECLVNTELRAELGNLRAAWRVIRSQGRTDDAVRMVGGLVGAAGWRDLTEVWDWSLELADDPDSITHDDAAEIFGLAAASAWSRGELDRADTLADSGLAIAGGNDGSCHDAKALVALSRADFALATDQALAASRILVRPTQSLAIAALARAYDDDLDTARALNDEFRADAVSPTLLAFHHYTHAEIDALAGDRMQAVSHYDAAIELARTVGSTFIQGIASVGRLSQFAADGRTHEALEGYRELIDYWERTGAWVQQWTTLRNLADVLASFGHGEPATILRHAAACAPDAPPLPAEPSPPPDLHPVTLERLHDKAVAAGRADILRLAREAIAKALL